MTTTRAFHVRITYQGRESTYKAPTMSEAQRIATKARYWLETPFEPVRTRIIPVARIRTT